MTSLCRNGPALRDDSSAFAECAMAISECEARKIGSALMPHSQFHNPDSIVGTAVPPQLHFGGMHKTQICPKSSYESVSLDMQLTI